MNPSPTHDSATANRLRDEWNNVKAALQNFTGSEIDDPLGADGLVTVKLKFFKANGGGEVLFLKGNPPEDHRYTRFRAWGPSGTEFLEKSSYLVKANGVTEFHKRRLENGDQIIASDSMDEDDKTWAQGLT